MNDLADYIDDLDKFARAALAGIITGQVVVGVDTNEADLASECYGIAEAMMAEREKRVAALSEQLHKENDATADPDGYDPGDYV